MDFDQYVTRVDYHLERLGVATRPSYQSYLDAWSDEVPAVKVAEIYDLRTRASDLTVDLTESSVRQVTFHDPR